MDISAIRKASWTIDRRHAHVNIMEGDRVVAQLPDCYRDEHRTAKRDARLIALAPLGLEAIELLQVIAYEPIGDAEASDRQILDDITAMARAFLAKVPE